MYDIVKNVIYVFFLIEYFVYDVVVFYFYFEFGKWKKVEWFCGISFLLLLFFDYENVDGVCFKYNIWIVKWWIYIEGE